LDGVIVVDKPEGWTSHDVVGKMRGVLRAGLGMQKQAGKSQAGKIKVGHLGTLDPIATGVLPLVVGRATRLAQFYTRSDKVYEAQVRLGWATTTYDRAGEPVREPREFQIAAADLERHLDKFRGKFMQTPPAVSAKRVDGRRAYELARKDIAVELDAVEIEVYELTVLGIEGSQVRLRAHCSGGTYLRSIAHDLGQSLGCGGHISELRRTASGEFGIAQARSLEQLQSLAAEERLTDAIVPAVEMLPDFPSVFVDDAAVAEVRNGRNFAASPFRSQPASQYVKAVSRQGELIAVGEAVLPNIYHPLVVL
jgi:tRNA pseudouridine55 synthase